MWCYKHSQSFIDSIIQYDMHSINLTMTILFFSQGEFYTIIDLPEGDHQYKFFVDGQWVHSAAEVSFYSQSGGWSHQWLIEAAWMTQFCRLNKKVNQLTISIQFLVVLRKIFSKLWIHPIFEKHSVCLTSHLLFTEMILSIDFTVLSSVMIFIRNEGCMKANLTHCKLLWSSTKSVLTNTLTYFDLPDLCVSDVTSAGAVVIHWIGFGKCEKIIHTWSRH